MRFLLGDLEIIFPYDYVYPEQFEYMRDIKKVLDQQGHCLLEMPSGTGKTICLLSITVAYQMKFPSRKLIYCSRTVPEIEKALAELKRLMDYRAELGFKDDFLGIGLTSRKNLCVHEEVSKEKNGVLADAKCRNLTAPWMRKAEADSCQYFETLETGDPPLPKGVFTLEEFKSHSKSETICPYFFARKLLPFANVIIYSYHYLLDPKVAEQVSRELSKESIVVFDEAHNIDNVCTESLSIDITRPNLEGSSRSLNDLSNRIEQ